MDLRQGRLAAAALRDLQHRARGLGAALEHPGLRGRSRRGRPLHRRQRGLSDAGSERNAGELLWPPWEAILRSRVGQMMDNYLDGGVQRIYWLTLPTQRDPARKAIADDVNQAVREAAAGRGAAVRVVDLVSTFMPGDSYRDSIPIDGKQTIVRMSDGIHLNEDGSSVAADLVLQAMDRDFDY